MAEFSVEDGLITAGEYPEMTDDFRPNRSSIEKAAILMLGLGEEAAGEVIRMMPPDKILTLSRAMEHIPVVRREELARTSEELLQECDASDMLAGNDYISRTLQQALGQERARSLMKFSSSIESNPTLEKLLWLDTSDILGMIRNEKPQLQAVVLACLSPDKGSAVLSMLPDHSRLDLANRLARLKEIPLTSLDAVADLISTYEHSGGDAQPIHGAGHLAEMLNHMDDYLSSSLLDGIRDNDASLGNEVDELRLNFEHLLNLDLGNLSVIIEACDQDVLAMALKGVPELRLQRVLGCLSKRASKYLREEIENLGSVRISAVRNARHQIIELARKLESEEKVELHAHDELVV
ncbi:flagellar motor switch protein FliG [Parendozoicomonas haliclonae]|uniref:Flagellar motor switch protein FliG n=1 Tax=Parendozoicomonas haliclonae TaxID=1960125 RepID=A0A1X7ANG5_9GAMM|nr:FliG C-terminal domain-containing protein [Parendozoicomonas haliclonae]SMA49629.1 Flagellar motor switch protein FliG [Parendozoicomonas haliclonae]